MAEIKKRGNVHLELELHLILEAVKKENEISYLTILFFKLRNASSLLQC